MGVFGLGALFLILRYFELDENSAPKCSSSLIYDIHHLIEFLCVLFLSSSFSKKNFSDLWTQISSVNRSFFECLYLSNLALLSASSFLFHSNLDLMNQFKMWMKALSQDKIQRTTQPTGFRSRVSGSALSSNWDRHSSGTNGRFLSKRRVFFTFG